MSAWLARQCSLHSSPTSDRFGRFAHLRSSSEVSKEHVRTFDSASGLDTRADGNAHRSIGSPSSSFSLSKNDNMATPTAMHERKDERIAVGSSHVTVSILQGPHNHAIWRARLLAALRAEDEALYAAATGELPMDASDQSTLSDDEVETERRRRAHARCIPFITSTLPDAVFAMVMNHSTDAYKLMEALDTRFRPYPRYAGAGRDEGR